MVRAALLATLVVMGPVARAAGQSPAPPVTREFPLALDSATRLLVIAPHPDDEALGAAGLVQRVRAGGGTVRIVVLTSGDGFPEGVEVAEGVAHPAASDFRGYGVLREHETRSAMAILGVASEQISFLGFPDEGLCQIGSTYLFDKRRSFESPYTARTSPPVSERIVRGVKYRGVDVRRELERVIASFAPTLIALSHPADEHPDHCSTHLFVHEALNAVPPAGHQRRLLHYLVHYGQWPLTADGGLGARMTLPDGISASGGSWWSLSLTASEADAKKRALLAYPSQMLMIGRFMLAFGRGNELFLDGEPATLPACWCDGENIAAPPSGRSRSGRP